MSDEDYKIEAIFPNGKGGQHAGSPRCDIKVTHIHTGLTATCGDCRSQKRNRDTALLMVKFGLIELGYTA
jgi:protein subunit release factor A